MKKVVCLLVTIVLVIGLTSCMKGAFTVFFIDKDNELADDRMEEVFTAISQKNKDALTNVFSSKAIGEAEDIGAGVDALLSFVQGEVVSWNRDESPMVFDNIEVGGKSKQLVTWYTLDTDEYTYLVLLIDYPIDTIDPKNVGVYSMRILRSEMEDELTGTLEDWTIPGIYILDN